MKYMHIRDFLRGGYKNITEPTTITKHGRLTAVWIPQQTNAVVRRDRVPGADEDLITIQFREPMHETSSR